ncbi:glycoside hydrolase family 15 protein [Limnochorda pilosa]|uniref:Glycosyl hydrolase n=1 Tax=Limnochorda pilosa TaxID=1555112 RepID=A0A0K2SMW4_LIMPI|nr:hypothetical protein [Limnochorda pilosa]BAS28347.1 glycosyl hydrolase [Limnochorda pilosa]
MYFVGMNPDNHVPLGNGRVLVWLDQYESYRPVDRLKQVFYPDFDLSSASLGDEGNTVLVKDRAEKIWYDPFGVVREASGQLGEVVSIDETEFVEGLGLYRVLSHKGNTAVESLTWVPRRVDAVVRRFQVRTVRGNGSQVVIHPVIQLKNASRLGAHLYLSRLSETGWLAVTCKGAVDSGAGLIADVVNDRRFTSGQHGSTPTHVIFRCEQEVPRRTFSRPVYLVLAYGRSRAEAIAAVKQVLASPDCLLAETRDEWHGWLASGTLVETGTPWLDHLWRVSLSLLRTSLQEDGLPVLVGFRPYQGNVWVRDSVWIARALAATGHLDESLRILRALRALVRERGDGYLYFAYNGTMKLPTDHTVENDSAGLLLAALATHWRHSGDRAFLAEFAPWIRYLARWILAHRDGTGMMAPCAGISEVFGPHLGRAYEHMTWSTGISAWGLLEAAGMLEALPSAAEATELRAAAAALTDRLLQTRRDGALVRSLESPRLDASALLFFRHFPLLPDLEVARPTVTAVEARLTDPFLGGVWRHEELVTEEGDLKPWVFYTFALAEAHLPLENLERSWQVAAQALSFASHCGLLPEMMYTHDLPRGLAMPSLSQSSYLHYLLGFADLEGRTLKPRPASLDSLTFRNLVHQGARFDLPAQAAAALWLEGAPPDQGSAQA